MESPVAEDHLKKSLTCLVHSSFCCSSLRVEEPHRVWEFENFTRYSRVLRVQSLDPVNLPDPSEKKNNIVY